MDAVEFKRLLEKKASRFFSDNDGKSALEGAEGPEDEQFKFIFDEFAYWLGQTEGM